MKTLKNILIPLTLIAAGSASAQTVTVSPTALNFSGLVGGQAVSQTLNVSVSSGSAAFAAFPTQTWLTVNPSSGTAPAQLTVTANPANLAAGSYTDTNFRIVTSNQTIVIPVTFNVGAIAVTPQSLSLSYTLGSATLPSQTLTVSGQNLNYTATASTATGGSWLAVTQSGNTISVLTNGLALTGLSAGTYQGAVTVAQSGSSPINIPVTLTVNPEPTLTVTPTPVNLFYQIGGQNNQNATVTLSTNATTALPFLFGNPTVGNNPAGRNWIVINPTSGMIPAGSTATSVISYDSTANLPANSYSGSVPVTATGATTVDLPVNLTVSSTPFLVVPNQTLTFSYEIGGSQPVSQTVTAQSTAVPASATTGQMPITVSIGSGSSWLSVSPTANLTTGTPFTVSVNPAGLIPGAYNGTIVVSPAPGATSANGSQTINVTLTVANDPFLLVNGSATPVSINIPYQVGQSNPQAQAQTINLTSSTGAALNYTVTGAETNCSSVNWLALSQTSGATNGAFILTPSNLTSLTAGTTCTGTITVTATNPATGNAAINSPVTIPVSLYVSNDPMLVVNTPALTFTAAVNGGAAPQQLVVTSTNPSSALTYSVSESTTNGGNTWLTVGPMSGSTTSGSNAVNVNVVPGILSPGTYTGAITITSTGAPNSPITIPVTLQVTSGGLTVSTSGLSFSGLAGGAAPAAQTVMVTGTGGTLNFTATANSGSAGVSWLSATPASGTTPATLSISANPANLPVGTYAGTVTVTSPNAAGSPQVIAVTFTVSSGTLTATPAPTQAGLTFTQPAGGTAPAAQTISLAGSPGAVNFTATGITATGGNWLTVTPASGATPASVSISANAGSLAVGSYTGTVTINAPGATPSQLIYPITLNVVAPITMTATPASLSFGYTANTAAPAAQTVVVNATAPAPYGTIAKFPFGSTVTTTDGGKWLSVTPTTGMIGDTVSVAVNPQGLAVGNYTGSVAFASTNGNGATPVTVSVKLTVTNAPTPVIAAVANAGSYQVGEVSPGEEVAIFGSNFGPSSVVSATLTNNVFPTTLSNTQVLFDGVPAPIIAVANGQVNVMAPYGIAGRPTTTIQVSYLSVSSAGIAYNVANTVPGIYTVNQSGSGQGAILDQDYSVNSATKPAAKGSVIAIYMTGEGVSGPVTLTGEVAPLNGTGLYHPQATVTVTIGGVNAPVQYAGSAPGLVYGVMQVNVQVPSTVASGNQPVVVTVGSGSSQAGVTAAIQ